MGRVRTPDDDRRFYPPKRWVIYNERFSLFYNLHKWASHVGWFGTVETFTPRNVEWLKMFVMFTFKSSSVCFIFYVWQKWMIESRGNQGASLRTPDNGRDFYPYISSLYTSTLQIVLYFTFGKNKWVCLLGRIGTPHDSWWMKFLPPPPPQPKQFLVLFMKKSSTYFKFYFR